MISHRFATQADVEQFYGELPAATMTAIAICQGEECVALIGLAKKRGHLVAFSEFKPELAPHLKSISVLRAIKAAQRMFADAVLPVFTICQGSSALLSRMGFVPYENEVYQWQS